MGLDRAHLQMHPRRPPERPAAVGGREQLREAPRRGVARGEAGVGEGEAQGEAALAPLAPAARGGQCCPRCVGVAAPLIWVHLGVMVVMGRWGGGVEGRWGGVVMGWWGGGNAFPSLQD